MKRIILGLSLAFVVLGIQSCNSQARPENKSGHDLWLGDISTPVNAIHSELLSKYDSELGDEGFRIKHDEKGAVIYANTKAGIMYGTYHLKRLGECGDLKKLDKEIVEVPAFKYRILNHWDNPNGTVERGFAGRSLWKWNELPDRKAHV